MGRPRKTPPASSTPSTTNATPPSAPTDAERLSRLNERANRAAIRSKIRKRIALDLKIDDFETLVDLADEFGEDISVVARACLRFGLRHHRQWASKATGISPFTEGDWTPRPPSQLDPMGLRVASPILPVFGTPPPIDREAAPIHGVRSPRTTVTEEVEMVFAPPPPRDPRAAACTPNGATISMDRGEIAPQPDPQIPDFSPSGREWQGVGPLPPYPVDGMIKPPLAPVPTPEDSAADLDAVPIEELL